MVLLGGMLDWICIRQPYSCKISCPLWHALSLYSPLQLQSYHPLENLQVQKQPFITQQLGEGFLKNSIITLFSVKELPMYQVVIRVADKYWCCKTFCNSGSCPLYQCGNYSHDTSLHKLNIDSHSGGWMPLDTLLQWPTKWWEEITNVTLSAYTSHF
jgi:hypothetical protein